MWAAPRKPCLHLSPYNSMALLRADHKAKLFSAAIRDSMARILKQLVACNQSGAIKGGGTEFPMFIARLFLQHAAIMKVSAGLLFGCMQKECYSVLLELALGPLLTPGERDIVFQGLGMDELRKQSVQCSFPGRPFHCLLGSLPLPKDLVEVVCEWQRLAWFYRRRRKIQFRSQHWSQTW